ncbi:hemolysin family protein [Commensalibacter oyaizuii]|uniref:Hemolysin family protein n=1 Tax=Commensalibacter oyaizuii TaxID=3043873 RepID=A0ABT6Q1H8_9PROT|nr:hemolysin family protein [Commensalibacter sp. TBRC 16381]MDI2090962.1 hemolysin family protein [Commensalibacter sp. TBRC 16381]
MIISILVIICLIFLNGIFAMGELALISSRKTRLVTMQRSGVRGADRALRLMDNPQSFLPTIQIGITLVSIFEGAFGGAKIEAYLGAWLRGLPFVGAFADDLSIFIVVLCITFFMLIFGELVPKQIALQEPELIAVRLAWIFDIMSRVASPGVWILGQFSGFILKLFGRHKKVRVSVTEEELRAYIAEGAQAGILEVEERNMIERLLRLADRPVRAVMRPRTEIAWVERNTVKNELKDTLLNTSHTRLVVCEGGIDNPVGIISTSDVLGTLLRGKELSIDSCLQLPLVVPDSMSALDTLERLRADVIGVVLVLDEYGSFEGIVTVSDIFKAIVGEINQPLDIPRLESGVINEYILEGTTLVDGVKDQLHLDDLPAEGSYHTLAGLILALLRRVPVKGDKVVFSGWLFEVIEMDGRRVTKVKASRQPVAQN